MAERDRPDLGFDLKDVVARLCKELAEIASSQGSHVCIRLGDQLDRGVDSVVLRVTELKHFGK